MNVSTKKPTVYIVPAVDTEGPVVDPNRNDLLDRWEKVEKAYLEMAAPSWRFENSDSLGRPALISWFLLDWVGFKANPRGRSLGHHQVFDRYRNWGAQFPWADEWAWHYHHVPPSGVGNEWNPDWTTYPSDLSCPPYEDILAHKLIERNWFPTSYRAGGTIQCNRSSAWLEKFIFSDYSQRAPLQFENYGTLIDWSRAPLTWRPYHPSSQDYQGRGEMKRWISRCIDAMVPSVELAETAFSEREAARAFEEAREHGSAIASFFLHDYRPMAKPFTLCFDLIREQAEKYRDVQWVNSTATEALLSVTGFSGREAQLNWDGQYVRADRPPFSEAPFAAIQMGAEISALELERVDHCTWEPKRKLFVGTCLAVAHVSETGNLSTGRWVLR